MLKRPGAALAAAAALALGTTLAAAAGDVTIYNFEGQTSVVRNRRTLPPDFDMPLRDGDILRTETESFMDVTMNKLAGFKLMASGSAEVANTTAGSMLVRLTEGSALVSVKPMPSGASFRLETPTAVAETREAQFSAVLRKDARGAPVTTFAVRKGTLNVHLRSASATVALIEERALDAPLEGYLPSIRTATEDELKTLHSTLSIYVSDT